jgi:hypothetical protein
METLIALNDQLEEVNVELLWINEVIEFTKDTNGDNTDNRRVKKELLKKQDKLQTLIDSFDF